MKKNMLLIAILVLTPFGAPVFADEEPQGSKVVDENEPCPEGMVVSGMTGGEDATTKICVSPNSASMPSEEE